MTVYVDDPVWKLGRMKMCHMLADSTEDLLAMADAIGVERVYIQHPGTTFEHFDICKSKRSLAVAAGAVEVSARHMALILSERISKR